MGYKFNPSVFREYDIRGVSGRDVSIELASQIGSAFATFLVYESTLKGKTSYTVSVGRDCRLTSDSYAEALIASLRENGLNVLDLGVCPTPLTYFSIFHRALDGGIMVTGSHNPSEYNGFKICVGKDTVHGLQIQRLRAIIEESKFGTRLKPGNITPYAVIPDYLDRLTQEFSGLPRLKVVLDAGNGTAGPVAPELFRRMGAEIIPLYCEMDGNFPNHHPDPTVPENLSALVSKVLETNAHFGVAFDGDSDRLGVVDSSGRILFGDEILVVLSRAVLSSRPGATIISEVKSSHRLYEDITKHGGNPLMWKTGHSLIKSKMKETGALLAGEMSGHIFFSDRYYGYDDAIYAAARFYEIAATKKGETAQLLTDLAPSFSTPEIRIDCKEETKFALVDETKRLLGSKYRINDIDGVRADFGDGWGLVRASNTQPVIVMRFEAGSELRLKEIRTIMEGALREAGKKIGHEPVV